GTAAPVGRESRGDPGGLEERGYARLTMQGIAARAGVGKQTVHRWWPSKAGVVLDALTGLMAQALLDPGFAAAFRERFLSGRRAVLRGMPERASARGEIAADADPGLLVDVVYGVLWYRLMPDHAPLDEEAGRALAALVLCAAR
ncbi:TetR/AcrR family transcriptional regulator, partial [Actinomadura kijaniata]|uniref:TetR/AcrR family transcriptional regulator n=1 Tax=Actinomadura kijaniata TaxID=46161 RepID=UPI003F1E0B8F